MLKEKNKVVALFSSFSLPHNFTSLEGDDCLAELFDHMNPSAFYSHHYIALWTIFCVHVE